MCSSDLVRNPRSKFNVLVIDLEDWLRERWRWVEGVLKDLLHDVGHDETHAIVIDYERHACVDLA